MLIVQWENVQIFWENTVVDTFDENGELVVITIE